MPMLCHACWSPQAATATRCANCGASFEARDPAGVDLFITGFRAPASQARFARFLAERVSTSEGQPAYAWNDRLPVALMKAVPRERAAPLVAELARLGVGTYERSTVDSKPCLPADPPASIGRRRRGRIFVSGLLVVVAVAVGAAALRSVIADQVRREALRAGPPAVRGQSFPTTAVPRPALPALEGFVALPFDAARRRSAALNDAGRDAFRAGDRTGAIARFEEALAGDPTNAALRANLSTALVARAAEDLLRGDARSAIPWLRRAVAADPSGALAPRRLGEAHRRAGDDAGALAAFEQAVERDPDDAEALRLLAETLYQSGETVAAGRRLQDLLGVVPRALDLRRHLRGLGREWRVERDFDFAESAHFRMTFDPALRPRVSPAWLALLEDAYGVVGTLLDEHPARRLIVTAYSDAEFRSRAPVQHWTGAVYDGRIRVPIGTLADAGPGDLEDLLRHEYAHAVVDALSAGAAPAWLSEGIALYASERNPFNRQAVFGHIARVRGHQVPALEDIEGNLLGLDEERARLAYHASFNVVHYLFAEYGREGVRRLLGAFAEGLPPARAIPEALGVAYDDFEGSFRGHVLDWRGVAP